MLEGWAQLHASSLAIKHEAEQAGEELSLIGWVLYHTQGVISQRCCDAKTLLRAVLHCCVLVHLVHACMGTHFPPCPLWWWAYVPQLLGVNI